MIEKSLRFFSGILRVEFIQFVYVEHVPIFFIATQKWERNLVDADERKEVDGDKGENRFNANS